MASQDIRHTSTPLPGTWTPLFSNDESTPFRQAVDSIAVALTNHDLVGIFGGNLSSGSVGVALFYHYLACVGGASKCRIEGCHYLRHAIAWGLHHDVPPSLIHGSTGIAWTSHHIRAAADMDATSFCARTDETLLRLTSQTPFAHSYDLAAGLVGYGIYALERMDTPVGRPLLEQVVTRLSELAIETEEGFSWLTPPRLAPEADRARYPEGSFNLGLAHGIPAVIGLLGYACALDVVEHLATRLLNGAVRWLLGHRNAPGSDSCFAYHVPGNGHRPADTTTRIAFCYGDLGVSAALLGAARAAGRRDWEEEAIAIGKVAAERPFDRSGVRDAGICHGAAGNGHIFNRLYQATGDQTFYDAARRWFLRAIHFRKTGTGVGGFRAWGGVPTGPGSSAWRHDCGFAGGAAGVGLTLIGATTAMEPRWDRLLMLSVPASSLGPHRCLPNSDTATTPVGLQHDRPRP